MTLSDWSPVVEEKDDLVPACAAAALHGLFDSPGTSPASGQTLPPLWHWLAFRPDAAQRHLGADGHPRLGAFMPPTGLPRRMFAGGRLELRSDLPIGAPLHRRSVVTDVVEKSGRSGRLVFVDVTNEISLAGGGAAEPAVVEVQNIVYREAAPAPPSSLATPSPMVPAPAPEDGWEWSIDLGTEPTLLFRFSALTYNAHRIHYDREYATGVEGYPGLVVHGPLQAIGLAELARRNAGGRTMTAFSFRAVRPAFDGPAVRLRGRLTSDGSAELVALDGDGQHSMEAEAHFAG